VEELSSAQDTCCKYKIYIHVLRKWGRGKEVDSCLIYRREVVRVLKRKTEPEFVNFLKIPGIHSKESIPPTYVRM
jgi:hypothetical protein